MSSEEPGLTATETKEQDAHVHSSSIQAGDKRYQMEAQNLERSKAGSSFTWVPLYRELAYRLAEWENRQTELIDLLESLRKAGYVVSSMNDQDPPGTKFRLQEIPK